MSILQLVRSRTVGGVVVDSLGLQLRSLTPGVHHRRAEPGARRSRAPRATRCSSSFAIADVIARRAERKVVAPYGQVINLGVVQFAVRERPKVDAALLGIAGREQVIDALLAGLLVTRRDGDGRDRRRLHGRRSAHGPADRQLERARVPDAERAVGPRAAPSRKREFLAEQLAQTDSMLARAQAELSSFLPAGSSWRAARASWTRSRAPRCSSRAGSPSSRRTGGPSVRWPASSSRRTRPRGPRRSARWLPRPPWRTTRPSARTTASS